MAEYTPELLGSRIQAELKKRDWTMTTLRAEVAKVTHEARGTSWGSIWSYANGKAPKYEPSRKVVDALATIFDVLPGHLLFGGPRTADESPLRLQPEDREAINRRRVMIYEAVRKEIGPLAPAGIEDRPLIEMIMSATVAVADSMRMAGDGYRGENEDARHLEAAIYLGRALAGPLKTLGLNAETWPQAVKGQYLLQTLASLMVPLDIKYDRAVREWSEARAKATKQKTKRKRAA